MSTKSNRYYTRKFMELKDNSHNVSPEVYKQQLEDLKYEMQKDSLERMEYRFKNNLMNPLNLKFYKKLRELMANFENTSAETYKLQLEELKREIANDFFEKRKTEFKQEDLIEQAMSIINN